MTYFVYKKMAKQYIDSLPSLKRSEQTEQNYTSILDGFGEYLKRNQAEVSPATAEAWRVEMFKTVKINTIRHYMTVLCKFFDYCVLLNCLEQNPMRIIDKPSHERTEFNNLLTLNEIEKLMTEQPKGMNKKTACRNRAIVILLLQSGLRSDELRELKLWDLDFENGVINVEHGKGDKRRQVPFPRLARETVTSYLKSGIRPNRATDSELLFGTDADENGHGSSRIWKKMSSAGLNTMIKRYVKSITGKEIHTHLLRHAAASLWDDMGVEMRTIQNALGHASLRTTETVYVSLLNKHKAANTINAAFDGGF